MVGGDASVPGGDTAVKWLVAVVGGCLVAAVLTVARTSGAGFSAQTDNSGDGWQAGAISLSNDAPSGSVVFSASDGAIEPGDTVTKCVNVTYAGSWTGVTSGGVVKTYGSWAGGLAQYATLMVERGSGGATTSCSGFTLEGSPVWKGKLTDLTTNFAQYSQGFGSWIPVTGSLTKTYRLTLTVDIVSAAANLSTTGSLTWEIQHPTGGTGYADRVLNDLPAAYWRFDDGPGASTAREATNQYPGTYEGNPDLSTTGWTLSGWNNSASFVHDGNRKFLGDGLDNRVVVPRNSTFLPPVGQPFSVEFSVEITSTSLQRPGVVRLDDASGPDGWLVYYYVNNKALSFKRNAPNGAYESFTTTNSINLGGKYFCVATYDGNLTVRWYINGSLNNTTLLPDPYPSMGNGLNLPLMFANGDEGPSPLTIDDISIFRKELTSAQVSSHYSALALV